MKKLARREVCLAVACLLAALSGCAEDGPKLGLVRGVVTSGGAPLEGVTIIFEPSHQGRSSVAKTKADGSYELRYNSYRQGAELGTHTVRFETLDGEDAVPGTPRIPKQYGSQSTLTAEVKNGKNTFDFDLDLPARKPKEKSEAGAATPTSEKGKE